LGYSTYLYFCGDPDLPGEEEREGGRLHLRRWAQWISAQHRGGVYDGEEGKLRDWDRSLPPAVLERVIEPALQQRRRVVVMGEEWHTAASVTLIDAALRYRDLRERVVMLWNANNVFGFWRIGWAALVRAATITTVSRYMKHRIWAEGVNPVVIPNGIPKEIIRDPPADQRAALRDAAAADVFVAKIGRFDPDKRWLQAVNGVAMLKRAGLRVRMLIRGGREPHGVEVLSSAARQGLSVEERPSPTSVESLAHLLAATRAADVLNITSYVPEEMMGPIYSSVDAVLANSGHEPFGLVGLEVMAAGGLAVTGSTGEDYAEPYRNAIVIETEDAVELANCLRVVCERPELAAEIRRQGRATARVYTWDRVIMQLLLRIELAAAQQGVDFQSAPASG
jgi:glycosyltransferase involved in cell wall biosynthesis